MIQMPREDSSNLKKCVFANRYAVGDRSKCTFAGDGPLALYIQSESTAAQHPEEASRRRHMEAASGAASEVILVIRFYQHHRNINAMPLQFERRGQDGN